MIFSDLAVGDKFRTHTYICYGLTYIKTEPTKFNNNCYEETSGSKTFFVPPGATVYPEKEWDQIEAACVAFKKTMSTINQAAKNDQSENC